MSRYVIDSSVAVKWFVPEVHSSAAARLLEDSHELFAPDFLPIELANVIWKKRRQGELSPEESEAILRLVPATPLQLCTSLEVLGTALQIANTIDQTVYDSLYLALAYRENAPLLTADKRLYNSARETPLQSLVSWIEEMG